MPNQYSHTVCSYETLGENNFKAAIKLQLSSEEEAKRWLDEFKRSSGFIWRTSKTYPNGGRYNKFRVMAWFLIESFKEVYHYNHCSVVMAFI